MNAFPWNIRGDGTCDRSFFMQQRCGETFNGCKSHSTTTTGTNAAILKERTTRYFKIRQCRTRKNSTLHGTMTSTNTRELRTSDKQFRSGCTGSTRCATSNHTICSHQKRKHDPHRRLVTNQPPGGEFASIHHIQDWTDKRNIHCRTNLHIQVGE